MSPFDPDPQRVQLAFHLIWNRVVVPFDTSHPNRGMEDGTKGAAAVLDYQGGQVCNKYRRFFFSEFVQRKLRNFVAVATGSRIPDDYPTPDQLSEFDRFGEFPSFKTSQVFGKNRSEESIHHGKEDDSAKWWVTMVPILGCPGNCRTGKVKSINHSGVTVEIQIEAIEKHT